MGHISAFSFYSTNRGRGRRVSSRLFWRLVSTAVPALQTLDRCLLLHAFAIADSLSEQLLDGG